MVVLLKKTLLFSVYDRDNVDVSHFVPTLTTIDCSTYLTIRDDGSINNLKKEFTRNIERVGYTVLRDVFEFSALKEVRKVIVRNFFERRLLPAYDLVHDEFDGFDSEENNITRMPRIGNGKHNIHFDPEFSEEHKALSRLVSSSPILNLLSHYMGFECSLRESGISVTRPKSCAEVSGSFPDREYVSFVLNLINVLSLHVSWFIPFVLGTARVCNGIVMVRMERQRCYYHLMESTKIWEC